MTNRRQLKNNKKSTLETEVRRALDIESQLENLFKKALEKNPKLTFEKWVNL